MTLSNRKPLFLALALTFAAPIAFAQSTTPTTETQSTTESTTTTQDPATATQSTTESTTTESATAQSSNAATPATPATPQSQSTDATAATGATPATPATPAKKNWSDLDVDKNGTLSLTEAASVQSLSKAFAAADANADGELTQDEYKAYLAASGKGEANSSSGG